jgi:hypothetical protein
MRSPRYYLNQVLINTAVWCLERVQFRSLTNTTFQRERTTLIKRLRRCV